MARLGITTARWQKEYAVEGVLHRTQYAVRSDGKVLRNDSFYETPTYGKAGWHSFGWKLTKFKGGEPTVEQLHSFLVVRGFERTQ